MTAKKVLVDTVLGPLIWDDVSCSLDGKFRLSPDREIDFSIEFLDMYSDAVNFEDVDFSFYLAEARLQIETLLQSEEKFRFIIADHVLQNYCGEFNIEGVDRSEIIRGVTLYEVVLFPQGGMDLYYSVGEELTWWEECDITVMIRDGEIREVFWL
jgi:hypothetical protein